MQIKKRKFTIREIVFHLRKLYSLYIIRGIWLHWFNPIYTMYFNICFLPLKQAIHFPIYIYGWPKLASQYGNIECPDICKRGMVQINLSLIGSPQSALCNTVLNIWGKWIFHGKCIIGSGNQINIGTNGLLEMGANTKIMNSCNLTAYSTVKIGAQSWIVHRCQVLDTNFHYMADFKHGIVKKAANPITIGDYCWICNSSTVTGGSYIPNKTIVTSNSLVNKNFSKIPEESIIGGIPACLISTGYRRVESTRFEVEINNYFRLNPEQMVYPIAESVDHNICNLDS